MSPAMQNRILRTAGVSLVTMLMMVLAQAMIQVNRVFEFNQLMVLLFVLFPFLALLCGAASHLLTGSPWAALFASTMAFAVVLPVLFKPSLLVYLPLYILFCLAGYHLSRKIWRKSEH